MDKDQHKEYLTATIASGFKKALEFREIAVDALMSTMPKSDLAPLGTTTSTAGRQLPDKDCIKLSKEYVLKVEERPKGLFYFKNGRWELQQLPPLQVRLIQHLHDLRKNPDNRRAKGVKELAVALHSSDVSISNQINKLTKSLESLGIRILIQTVESKWTFNPTL